jgi:3-isopropylmalate/(R)-2-methylmalate dehydratase small subunit
MTTQTRIRGRVWKFGDDVDTDVMAPWNTISAPWEERRGSVLHIRPGFVDQLNPGDLIVAGRNWGCGSSREHAPENLQLLGIGAVVAESFGRIYFRNCVAIAFPNLACPGIAAACEEGDQLELDIENGRVRNLTKGTELQGEAYTRDMLEIVEKGGLMKVLEERLGGGEDAPR